MPTWMLGRRPMSHCVNWDGASHGHMKLFVKGCRRHPPYTTHLTPVAKLSFLFCWGKEKKEDGWKKEKCVKRTGSTQRPQSRILYCFKPVTGSWTLGNFFLLGREVRESQQEHRKQRPYTCYPSSETYFDTLFLASVLFIYIAAAAAKSLQSCPTVCDPIDGSPPGSSVSGILQARTLEWVAISFSNAWKQKVKGKSLSRVWLCDPMDCSPPGPPSLGFSRQEDWTMVSQTTGWRWVVRGSPLCSAHKG